MNNLWEEYMRDVLGWSTPNQNKFHQPLVQSKEKGKRRTNMDQIISIGDEQFRMRVCRADFHGALVKVTKSRVSSHLGIQVR